MDLVEAFVARSGVGHGALDFVERIETGAQGDLVIIDPPLSSTGASAEAPQLFIDTAIRQASRGRGPVVCVAASNDVVFVATARGYLLRYSWDEYGNEKVAEVEVLPPKQQSDHRITALFTDPWANHVLLAVRSTTAAAAAGAGAGGAGGGAGGPSEVYYVHRRWTRARALPELKCGAGAAAVGGLGALTAVGWCLSQEDATSAVAPPATSSSGWGGWGGGGGGGGSAAGSTAAPGESCTGPILLGTESGALLEAVLDERSKKPEAVQPRTLIEPQPAAAAAGGGGGKDRLRGRHSQSPAAPTGSAAATFTASIATPHAFTSLYQVSIPATAGAGGAGGAGGGGGGATASGGGGGGSRKALLAATPSHLRIWITPPTSSSSSSFPNAAATCSVWQAFFLLSNQQLTSSSSSSRGSAAAAASPPPPLAVIEAVVPSPYSQLQLWWPEGLSELPTRFAWLVGGVVYHGDLDWEAAVAAADAATAAAAGVVRGGKAAAAAAAVTAAASAGAGASGGAGASSALLAPAGGGRGGGGGGGGSVLSGVVSLPLEEAGPEESPAGMAGAGGARSLVLTEYHHLLLLPGDRLRLVNRVNGRTVVERALRSPLTRCVTGETSREIDGLVRDPVSGTTLMAVDETLYDISLQHEGRGMWRVYLELQDWDAALRCCSGPTQRDEVHRGRAEAAVAAGDFRTAAVHFAKITDGRPAFEDLALLLSECGDPAALLAFLSTKLATLAGVAAAAAAVAAGGGGGGGGGGGAFSAGVTTGSSGVGAAAAAGAAGAGGPERAQCTLLAAWLTELYLDGINRALLESGGEAGEGYHAAVAALRTHLSDWVHVMDAGTTVSLLSSYGRLDELLQLAQLRGDHEGLIEQLMARPQPGGAVRALAVLRSPAVSRELVYKFAPGLVAAAAEEAVDFFIAERPPLDPRRLLPALLRYGEPDSQPAARRHVLRYVEFAIDVLGSTDSVVHNLAVALYSMAPGEEGEASLLRYLTRAGRGGVAGGFGGGTTFIPLYDTQYALRLAQECNKPRAAVRLMCQLGMYPDAVRAALALDLGLAKGIAGEPDQDDALRRKLWLQVARHVVQSGSKAAAAAASAAAAAAGASASGTTTASTAPGGNAEQAGSGPGEEDASTAHIRTAVEFLREADGLLRIEDILPFFPDFVTIDSFQAAICDSLERYGAAIAGLKADMAEATGIAEALRSDIALLGNRSAAVSLSQPCSRCGRAIGEAAPLTSLPQGGALPPFYVFPTGCAYHVACCAAEVTELAAPPLRKKIHTLMARLARVRHGSETAPPYGGQPAASVASLQEALAAAIGGEDPRNGELVVRLIETPFVYDSDKAEAESWAI